MNSGGMGGGGGGGGCNIHQSCFHQHCDKLSVVFQIHNKMVSCLFKAPLSFHAINPVGRIINRFSQDINNIDELLPFQMLMSCLYMVPGVATIVLAAIANSLLIIPIVMAMPIFCFLSKVFFTSATDIRRLMSIAGSPIYSHFSNTKEGLRTIRVYGRQKEFTDQAFRLLMLPHFVCYSVDICRETNFRLLAIVAHYIPSIVVFY